MMHTRTQESKKTLTLWRVRFSGGSANTRSLLRTQCYKHIALLGFTALLLLSSVVISHQQPAAHAANPGSGNTCSWYTIHPGDTLDGIAGYYRVAARTLVRANYISNINLIFAGRAMCIPRPVGASRGHSASTTYTGGIYSGGSVSWYNYQALQWSSPAQVRSLLNQAAARYGLPANLLRAVAWQESGWKQHVISRDGGIGVMQVMPYTAMSINTSTGIRRNPYSLWDNVDLGARYLSWLWHSFRGNLSRTISAYNEGGWAVTHRGIFNWRYVNNVLYLMRTL